ncbi:uncharacterized protein B0I36DRAFT_390830 [Microdochium trichocladiopsis]|uniref:MYND-type zinc finger protein samB n=1 Tax=Microdochium trichocladiopsis TaxID=1682393 RepID=A0A9P8YGV1_9PEZI|nr:uncharacterized protein B0I36DRAFT_390830 [Microdochium trichocladiopsis]KAH7040040.1 hypothetical protein B0I36DRAFT_390830 [Microdochium trichocladiopsis]
MLDGVETLFALLPKPEAHEIWCRLWERLDSGALWDSLTAAKLNKSHVNRDHRLLASRKPSCIEDVDRFWHTIAEFAISKIPADILGDSPQARQLRYYKWWARGKSDAEKTLMLTDNPNLGDVVRTAAAGLTSQADRACASCHKTPPDTYEFPCCPNCLILDGTGKRKLLCTYYCSKACAARDSEAHKVHCFPRRRVIRAVKLVAKLLQTIDAAASHTQWKTLAVRDGITYLEEVPRTQLAYLGEFALQTIVRDDQQPEATYLAALTSDHCREMLLMGDRLVRLLLAPLCQSIEVVNISPRNGFNPVCLLNSDHTDRPQRFMMIGIHTVLRLTLHSGEKLAADIYGAQFGWPEVVAPWDSWREKRTLEATCDRPGALTFDKEILLTLTEGMLHRDPSYFVGDEIRAEMARDIAALVLRKSESFKKSLGLAAFRKNGADYRAWETDIQEAARQKCNEVMQLRRASNQKRLYFDQYDRVQATRSPEEVEALRGVWLTPQDINKHGTNPSKLKALWKKRCMRSSKQAVFKKLGMHMQFK